MAWPDGESTGLRVRGGFEIDPRWQDREPQPLIVRSQRGRDFRLLLNSGESLINKDSGAAVPQDGAYAQINTAPGDVLRLQFIRRN